MPVGDLDEAYAIADRVRRNFATAAARFGTDGLLPTVSVGAALGRDPHTEIPDMLSIVDRALYRAKELGRNRVETEVPQDRAAVIAAPSIVPIIGQSRMVGGVAADRRWRAAG
jgi:diguanylate cyclase